MELEWEVHAWEVRSWGGSSLCQYFYHAKPSPSHVALFFSNWKCPFWSMWVRGMLIIFCLAKFRYTNSPLFPLQREICGNRSLAKSLSNTVWTACPQAWTVAVFVPVLNYLGILLEDKLCAFEWLLHCPPSFTISLFESCVGDTLFPVSKKL